MINLKIYDPPEIDVKEILRYAGAGEMTSRMLELLDSCLNEVKEKLTYKICWSQFPVCIADNIIDMEFAKVKSKDLAFSLRGCDSVVIFAACIGLEIDRMITKYSAISPAKSVIFQAIGSERVESLCNIFNKEIKEKMNLQGMDTKPRYSPGYGDFPIDFQKEIFRVLDCQRQIGATLNESLLMSPSKSVTAIIGITRRKV